MPQFKFSMLVASLVFVAFIGSCRKPDWTSVPTGRDKCDYVSGSSTEVSDDGQTLLPVFSKTFEPGTFKLQQLLMQERGLVGSIYRPTLFQVTYSGSKMYLVREGSDSTIIEFNAAGKPIRASSSFPAGPLLHFKFQYNAGKIAEIQYRNPEDVYNPQYYSFVKITYDAGKNNVEKLVFFDGSISYPYTYTFTYDNSKKPKGQYHPDIQYGQSFLFWPLLNHLNILPETNSTNLLTGWTFTEDPEAYIKKVESKYTNQTFDSQNKLVSYTVTSTSFGRDDISDWSVSWNCLK